MIRRPTLPTWFVLILVTLLAQSASAFYSPQLGRWVNRDPLEYLDGMNFYGYVADNPLYYTDPLGLSKVTVIIKIRGKISKVLELSAEEAKRLLKRRTDDALKPKPDRKYTGEVFVNMPDRKSAKKLAKEVSPCNDAVRHPKNAQGHPPHYHPVKSRSPNGRPKTEGTPHIGDEYNGSSPAFMCIVRAMEEGADIAIDLTPIIGDLRDAPELFDALDDTIRITYTEAGRTVELRNKDKERRTRRLSSSVDTCMDRCEKPLSAGSLLPGR